MTNRTALLLCLAAMCSSAPAQLYISFPAPSLAWQNQSILILSMSQQISSYGLGTSGSREGARIAAGATLVHGEGATPATTATKLAAAYPKEKRQYVEKTFQQLLEGHHEIERQFGIPRNDVAGAVAVFLGGSYEAYHNLSLSPERFKALVLQMRGVLQGSAPFAKATNEEKRELYEQMAIIGMFMATTQEALTQKPDARLAENMKQAAKGYLEQFLKTDAQRVEITATGLSIR